MFGVCEGVWWVFECFWTFESSLLSEVDGVCKCLSVVFECVFNRIFLTSNFFIDDPLRWLNQESLGLLKKPRKTN